MAEFTHDVPPTSRRKSRVAANPRKTGKRNEERIFEESLETEQTEELSQSSETSNSSSEEATKKKNKKSGTIKPGKLLPFQGKNEANLWIESIKASFTQEIEAIYEGLTLGELAKIPRKYEACDSELYFRLLKALLDNEATPEHEATQPFDKVTSHKSTSRRSGLRAMILPQKTINGRADTHETALVQEASTLRVIHSEGVYTLLRNFVRRKRNWATL